LSLGFYKEEELFEVRTEVYDGGYVINLWCNSCKDVVDFLTSEELGAEELNPSQAEEEVKQLKEEIAREGLTKYFPGYLCEHYGH
jgi:hypothetical protein